MKEFWIRLKSKTPGWAKKAQIFFASVAALGGTLLALEGAPEWAKEVAERLIFVGGGIAAFAQFVISNSSKHVDEVNTR